MSPANWLKLIFLAVVWGSSFVFIEVALAGFGPVTLVFVRVGLAALILAGIVRFRGHRIPRDPGLWAGYVLMGVLSSALPFGLIAWGQKSITASMASMLNATVPLFTMLITLGLGIRGRRRTTHTRRMWLGLLLGFAGVTILTEAGSGGRIPVEPGQLAVLGAALCYAMSSVYGKRFSHLPPLVNASASLACAAILLAPCAMWIENPLATQSPGPAPWAAVVAIAILSTALAYFLYFDILKTTDPTYVTLVTYLIPVVSLTLAFFFLGETVGPRDILGMLVIFAGLATINARPARSGG